MRWVGKAAFQRALSAIPAGERVNYWMQRRITGQMPRTDDHFQYQAGETFCHRDTWARHQPELPLESATLYEFGAGWDLITPLIFYGAGARRQTLVDLQVHIRLEQVSHSIAQYCAHRDRLEAQGHRLRVIDPSPVGSIEELESRFGLTYLAPCDARATGLPAGSVDFVTSTNTLEHIPPQDIAGILRESRRLLSAQGLVSCLIDLQDHYSFFDPTISAFNFLKYPDSVWRIVNSSMHYQNRLQLSDYRRLIVEAGLEIVEEHHPRPTPEDLATVRGLRLASRFRSPEYSIDELATRAVHLVARAAA